MGDNPNGDIWQRATAESLEWIDTLCMAFEHRRLEYFLIT